MLLARSPAAIHRSIGSRIRLAAPRQTIQGRRQLCRPTQALPEGAALTGSLPTALVPAALAGNPAALLVGGVAVAGVLGAVAWALQSNQAQAMGDAAPSAQRRAGGAAPPPRENAVLVFGATGRIGKRVVERLLTGGRTVVAAARDADAVDKALTGAGLRAGVQQGGAGVLFFEGVDVRDKESLRRPDLWKGVSQVLLVLSGKGGGPVGYMEGFTPEDIEAKGIANVVSVMPEFMRKEGEVSFKAVVPSGSAEEVSSTWEPLDDVIMGGSSSSVLEAAPDVGPDVARWKGQLIVEGGGFCGTRTKVVNCDLSAYDGIALRVKGDGSIFKLNVKTSDQLNQPEATYQTTFDTVAGQWTDVLLPWHSFVPVSQSMYVPQGPPLDPAKIAKFGLVYSRFEFNKQPNPSYKSGPFELLLQGGIRAYKAPRPQIVQLSSAGVERNALIGDNADARKKDVPIVQLNPGGVLNHKYAGELAIRASGYPYTVVRSTGMIDSNENGPFKVELDQGDSMSGSIGRDDVADLLTSVMNSPEAACKTFEARRSEALDGRGKAMSPAAYRRQLLRLGLDRNRWRMGLPPFPAYAPPPVNPVDAKRKEEIVRDIADVRAKFKASGMGVQEDRPAQQQQQQQQQQGADGVPANVAEARRWIKNWQAQQEQQGEGAGEVPPNVVEARRWIKDWQDKQGDQSASAAGRSKEVVSAGARR